MNDHELLEQELHSLGDELRTSPSIATAVLRRIASNVEVSSLTASGRLQTANPETTHVTKVRRFRDRVRPRFLTSATVAALVFVGAVLVFSLLRTDAVAFAQVRERIAAVRTASFQFKKFVTLRLPEGRSEVREVEHRVYVRGDGRTRIEGPDGIASIQSLDDLIKLDIDPKNRTATLRYLYEYENQVDILATLRTLHESAKASKIPSKEIAGAQCLGFRIEERQSTLLVWVDPRTLLPAYAERSYSAAILERDRDVQQVVETYDKMKFDDLLADDLFSVVPPADFTVTTVGTAPADRKTIVTERLVVTPNVGAGPLRFGMSMAEIVRLLGKPDSEDIHVPDVPVSDDTVEVDGIERPAGASLIVLTELHVLGYNGLGIRLTVEADDGLRGIQCLGQDSLGPEGRTFQGATDKGIQIGSSAQDVLAAYGAADKKPSGQTLSYDGLNLQFGLTEQMTVRIINLSDSQEHRLRFEWRTPREVGSKR